MPTNRGATPFLICCQEVIIASSVSRPCGLRRLSPRISQGHTWLAEWLAVDCAIDTSAAADGGFDSFYMACQNGHLDIVKGLVRLGLHERCVPFFPLVSMCVVYVVHCCALSCLYLSALCIYVCCLIYPVSLCVCIVSPSGGLLPSHFPCNRHATLAAGGSLTEARTARSPDVVENTFGTTPFYIAAQNGHLHLLQYLLTLPNVKVSAPCPAAPLRSPARAGPAEHPPGLVWTRHRPFSLRVVTLTRVHATPPGPLVRTPGAQRRDAVLHLLRAGAPPRGQVPGCAGRKFRGGQLSHEWYCHQVRISTEHAQRYVRSYMLLSTFR